MADFRRDFRLPDEDIQYLDNHCKKWEAIQDHNERAVVLYDFPFPPPFKPEITSFKIKIPADYTSGAALDMFFTDVYSKRTDGVAIPNLTEAGKFDGKPWWQWSRHYPDTCKWRAGIDNLCTHIIFIKNILTIEANCKR